MVERRIVVDTLKLNYQGLLNIDELLKLVDTWCKERGYGKFEKSHTEQVTKDKRTVVLAWQPWKKVTPIIKVLIDIKFTFSEVKDVVVVKDNRRVKMHQAKVLIVFMGILQSDWANRWEGRPLIYFIRAVIDQFVYKIHSDKYYGVAAEETMALYSVIKAYLNLQKY